MEACAWVECYLPDQHCFYRAKLLDVENGMCRVRFETLVPHDGGLDESVWVRWENIRDVPPPPPPQFVPQEVGLPRPARPLTPRRAPNRLTRVLDLPPGPSCTRGARAPVCPAQGEMIEVRVQAQTDEPYSWWEARTMQQVRGEFVQVRYEGWEKSRDEFVELESARPAYGLPLRQPGGKTPLKQEFALTEKLHKWLLSSEGGGQIVQNIVHRAGAKHLARRPELRLTPRRLLLALLPALFTHTVAARCRPTNPRRLTPANPRLAAL
ncbi:hypothetical protein T492DRAFT_835008 [Pavlovales sp. CCMP2436]|nr:hypothetical protein T492DRAFT_835008 [Pavlovales sp. CCMP2436]